MPSTGKKKTSKKKASAKKTVAKASPSDAQVKHARAVFRKLKALYPDATCELNHDSPFQLLIATILSAQCTDVMVNKVTPVLFEQYPDVKALAKANQADVEKIIKSTGFYRNKAKNIIGAAQAIEEDFAGQVPDTMEKLLTLPGVARKTANVVLGDAFAKPQGIVVDTHVKRLSQRLGLTEQQDPVKIERELMPLFPKKNWPMLSHLLIWHGRRRCPARKPDCENCKLEKICPKVGVET